MEGNQWPSLPWNLGQLRGFPISILNCEDQGASLPRSEWKVIKGFFYLGTWGDWEVSLSQSKLWRPRGFSTSIWMEGNKGASLTWNLGQLRDFSILILNCDDQGASLPRSKWKVTKELLYLGTWGDWEFLYLNFELWWPRGLSTSTEWKVTKGLLYLGTWGDWEVSLSQSWIVTTKGFLFLNLNEK